MWDDLFDKKFREAANEGLPSLDQSQMWNNIANDLDKQDKNRKFAWFWFVGAFILLVSTSYLVSKNHISFVNKNFVPITENEINKTASTITQPNQTNETSNNVGHLSPKTIDKTNTDLESKKQSNSSKEIQKGIDRTDEQLQQTITKPTANPPITINDPIDEVKTDDVAFDIVPVEEEIVASRNIMNVALLSGKEFGLLEEEEINTLQQENPIQVLPVQNQKWSLIVSSGALLYQRNIHSVNEELASFIDTKRNSERELFGISTSLLAEYDVKPGISIRGGLNYITLFERFDYQFTETEEEIRFSDDAYSYIRRDGTVQTFGGDVPFQVENDRRIGHNNRHNMLNVMVEGSVSKKIKKIRTEVKSGLSLTVAQSQNGKSIDTQLKPVEFNSDNSTLYGVKNTSGYWHIGAGLEFPLSRRISFRSDINYNVGLSPTNSSTEIYTQTYNMMGANVGLKYQF